MSAFWIIIWCTLLSVDIGVVTRKPDNATFFDFAVMGLAFGMLIICIIERVKDVLNDIGE